MMMARVAVIGAVRGFDRLTYEVPPSLAAQLRPGHRVLVPLRARRVTAIVTEVGENLDSGGDCPQPIIELLESRPLFDLPHLQLIEFLASYYMVSIGEAFRSVLPSLARVESHRVFRIHKAPHALARVVLNSLEKKIVDALARRAMTFRQLGRLGEPRAVKEALDRLLAEGWVTTGEATRGRHRVAGCGKGSGRSAATAHNGDRAISDPESAFDGAPEVELSYEQAAAVDAIGPAISQRYFEPFLLLGVTASGKTEVYIRLTAEALRAKRQVLVLVPEIVLADQLVRSFRARFGQLVAVAHSAQNIRERWASWMAALEGVARIMIGPRSAIFSPINELGLIVVDEEHDAAYKQEERIRYHARDLAVALGRFANCPVVLGSATPSAESYLNARRGRYRMVQLTRRVQQREFAPVEIIDLRQYRGGSLKPNVVGGRPEARPCANLGASTQAGRVEKLDSACSSKKAPISVSRPMWSEPSSDYLPLSPPLIRALEDNLAAAGQSLLFLNRRGYHNFLQCRFCGSVITCKNCSVSMTFHWQGRMLRCHYCGAAESAPDRCFDCGSFGLEGQGYGTERLVHTLGRLFPTARIARVDSDTSGKRGARDAILQEVKAGRIDILVGTQMITKGLDFPNITLVAVVLADLSLNLPDFRSAERTFQLLTQAAGRAGRGERSGRVLIQTYAPHHYSIRAARDQDYRRFIARELKLRRELMYPPFSQMALVRIEGTDPGCVSREAAQIAKQLAMYAKPETMRVLGPAPAPIERIRQRYRWQVLVKALERRDLRAALGPVISPQARYDVRVSVDIDPVSML
jgi:primosomal protein N' (replication factor Y)